MIWFPFFGDLFASHGILSLQGIKRRQSGDDAEMRRSSCTIQKQSRPHTRAHTQPQISWLRLTLCLHTSSTLSDNSPEKTGLIMPEQKQWHQAQALTLLLMAEPGRRRQIWICMCEGSHREHVKPDVIGCLVGKYYSNCISLAGCIF